jgi:hypothetical protein
MMEAHERNRSAEQLQRQGHQGRPVGKIPRAQLLLRSQPCELCDRDGSLIPFARTRTERDAAGDPRPSLEERYGSRENYIARIEAAAAVLVADRLLLPTDADAYVKAARECDRF